MSQGMFLTLREKDSRSEILAEAGSWVLQGRFEEWWLWKQEPCPHLSTAWAPQGIFSQGPCSEGVLPVETRILHGLQKVSWWEMRADPTVHVSGPTSLSFLASHDPQEIKPSNWEWTRAWMWSLIQPNHLCQERKKSSRKTSHSRKEWQPNKPWQEMFSSACPLVRQLGVGS